MGHFIWHDDVCKNTRLGVSGMQKVEIGEISLIYRNSLNTLILILNGFLTYFDASLKYKA